MDAILFCFIYVMMYMGQGEVPMNIQNKQMFSSDNLHIYDIILLQLIIIFRIRDKNTIVSGFS